MAEIGLGTVQFGMNYGISNKGGKTSTLDASKLLQVATDNHIDVLDTASAYGTSESVLGEILPKPHRFKVVTKISPLILAKIEKEDIEKITFKASAKVSEIGNVLFEKNIDASEYLDLVLSVKSVKSIFRKCYIFEKKDNIFKTELNLNKKDWRNNTVCTL